MKNLESLRSLQKRLREAKGADRELDDAIFAALFPEKSCRLVGMHEDAPDIRMFEFSHATGTSLRVTGSLDACVALMREVLPGWLFDLRQQHKEDWQARVHRRCLKRTPHDDVFASHRLSTHATLLAIVSALITKEEAKEKADDRK